MSAPSCSGAFPPAVSTVPARSPFRQRTSWKRAIPYAEHLWVPNRALDSFAESNRGQVNDREGSVAAGHGAERAGYSGRYPKGGRMCCTSSVWLDADAHATTRSTMPSRGSLLAVVQSMEFIASQTDCLQQSVASGHLGSQRVRSRYANTDRNWNVSLGQRS